MKLSLALLVLALPLSGLGLVAVGAPSFQDEAWSGPLPGEPILGFDAVGMNGDLRDQVHDYVADYGGATTVYCFIHEVSRATSKTIRALDEACLARRGEGLEALFVLLGKDQDETERYGLELPGLLAIGSPLAVSTEGEEGPGAWGLNREMTLTVVVSKNDVTVANFALLTTNATDVPAIMAAADGALHAVASFDDVQRELASLRERVRALEAQLAAQPAAAPARGGDGMRMAPGREAGGERAMEDPEEHLMGLVRDALGAARQPRRALALVADIEAALMEDTTLLPRFLQALDEIEANGAGSPELRGKLREAATRVGAAALDDGAGAADRVSGDGKR